MRITHTYHVCKLQTRVVLLVIPVSVVYPLSQELNGRLSAILFLLRHVQVIHKHHTSAIKKIICVLLQIVSLLLAHWRTKHPLSPAVKLAHYDILCLVGCCSSREVDNVRKVAANRHALAVLSRPAR